MQKHHVQIAIAIFVVVLIIIFALFTLHTEDGAVPKAAPIAPAPISTLQSVSGSYDKGTYTIEGEVETPTPCYQVSASSIMASTTEDRIRVDLSIPPDTGICLQEPATQDFSTALSAPEDSALSVYINGTLATSTP